LGQAGGQQRHPQGKWAGGGQPHQQRNGNKYESGKPKPVEKAGGAGGGGQPATQTTEQSGGPARELEKCKQLLEEVTGDLHAAVSKRVEELEKQIEDDRPLWQAMQKTTGQLQSVRHKLDAKTKRLAEMRAELLELEEKIEVEEAEKAALEVRESELARLCVHPSADPSTEQAELIMDRMAVVHALPDAVRKTEMGKKTLESLQQSIAGVQALLAASGGAEDTGQPKEEEPEDVPMEEASTDQFAQILKRHLGERLQEEALRSVAAELADARKPKRQRKQEKEQTEAPEEAAATAAATAGTASG